MKYNTSIVCAYFESCGLPRPTVEHRFHPVRRWRFDFAFVPEKVALEVQGGIWTGGRHTRGAALLYEWEKLNTAACLGWRILYCQPEDLCTLNMVEQLRATLVTHSADEKLRTRLYNAALDYAAWIRGDLEDYDLADNTPRRLEEEALAFAVK